MIHASPPMADFRGLMALEPVTEDRFDVPESPETGGRAYGGQLLAQALMAAQRTLPDARRLHSLHGYFYRPGAIGARYEARVERVRDGRGFSARGVSLYQNDRELVRLLASFQVARDGPEWSTPSIPEVPPPEVVTRTYDDFAAASSGLPREAHDWHGSVRPMDLRPVDPPDPAPGSVVTAPQRMWMRMRGNLGDDPLLHVAGLVYLTDSTLIDHVLLPLGHRWHEPGFDGASLDHALWLHRFARADEWLLFDQHVEATAGSRGLATGRVWTRDGRHVLTCSQEGLLQFPEAGAD